MVTTLSLEPWMLQSCLSVDRQLSQLISAHERLTKSLGAELEQNLNTGGQVGHWNVNKLETLVRFSQHSSKHSFCFLFSSPKS